MSWELQDSAGLRAGRGVAARLREGGFQAYFAGGCVRDLLLGLAAKDFDVATSATPDEVLRVFKGYQVQEVGAHFGVILVMWDGAAIEVATFRHDGVYLDGRRPEGGAVFQRMRGKMSCGGTLR